MERQTEWNEVLREKILTLEAHLRRYIPDLEVQSPGRPVQGLLQQTNRRSLLLGEVVVEIKRLEEEHREMREQRLALEAHLSRCLPDPEVHVPGPSVLGLLEQKNLIINHLKGEGVKIPEHLASPPRGDLLFTRDQLSYHLAGLDMLANEQGVTILGALFKTSKHTPCLFTFHVTCANSP